MKRVIVLALAMGVVASCTKEKTCNCGVVVDRNYDNKTLQIENYCTGNAEWFDVSPGVFTTTSVGEKWCKEKKMFGNKW